MDGFRMLSRDMLWVDAFACAFFDKVLFVLETEEARDLEPTGPTPEV
jgi:hypothetical protein